MADKYAWLIYHKATLNETSPLSGDGSTYAFGVATVPESDLSKALDMFRKALEKDRMELIEVYRCIRSDRAKVPDEAQALLAEVEEESISEAFRLSEVALSIVGNEVLN